MFLQGKKTVVGRINSKGKDLEAQVGLAQKGLDDCPGDFGMKIVGRTCWTEGQKHACDQPRALCPLRS